MDDKEFCLKCGVRISSSLFDRLVYPAFEFKKGKACFGCGKRIKEANMRSEE